MSFAVFFPNQGSLKPRKYFYSVPWSRQFHSHPSYSRYERVWHKFECDLTLKVFASPLNWGNQVRDSGDTNDQIQLRKAAVDGTTRIRNSGLELIRFAIFRASFRIVKETVWWKRCVDWCWAGWASQLKVKDSRWIPCIQNETGYWLLGICHCECIKQSVVTSWVVQSLRPPVKPTP